MVHNWVWWLTPVISTLWEAKVEVSLKPEVQDQPGGHGETLSLLKKKTRKKEEKKINLPA